MVSEATFTPPSAHCPHPDRWHAPDAYASETEVSVFLGALVHVLRPTYVVELGTYQAHTTVAMARQLPIGGLLDTVELDPQRAADARDRCAGLPVDVHNIDAFEFVPAQPVDLLFVDTDLAGRDDLLERYRPFASPRGFFAVHDTKVLAPIITSLFEKGVISHFLNLPTPRGLTVGRFA